MFFNHSNNPKEADFSAIRLPHHRVLVVDLNLGSRSVTNDASNVIQILNSALPLVKGDRVYYRDSEGIVDELIINGHNGRLQFATFAPVPVTQLLPILKQLHSFAH